MTEENPRTSLNIGDQSQKAPFRYIQPIAARGSTPHTHTLDSPFPIRYSSAKRLSITCFYLFSSSSSQSHSQQPRSSSTTSVVLKRPSDVIDLVSSDDEPDVPITPKRHRSIPNSNESALKSTTPSRHESPSSTQFLTAVEVPVKRPYAVVPKTPAAVAQRRLFEKNLRELQGPKITVVNEIDDSSPSTDFRFVQGSVIQTDVEHVDEDFMAGCTCYKENGRHIGCEYLYCECLDDSQLNDDGKRVFSYGAGKKDSRCLRNFYLESRNHIYECNKKCNCEANCKNRNVQHGRKVELEIFKTENRGWGLRCPVALRKGDFIDTYRGEIISVLEADERALKRSADEANYFFNYDKFCEPEFIPKSDFLEGFPGLVEEYYQKLATEQATANIKDDEELWENPDYVPYEYVCDGIHVGSPTRFMNHSCDPNCRLFTVSYNHADTNLYDLAFFTLEEIPAGTELTFDYKDEDDRTVITDEQARQVEKSKGYMPAKCLCGTSECRRYFFN
ncbi:MAG: hypothetical protein Q9168_008294 [Polycauliona sp. 1 TL-2023]